MLKKRLLFIFLFSVLFIPFLVKAQWDPKLRMVVYHTEDDFFKNKGELVGMVQQSSGNKFKLRDSLTNNKITLKLKPKEVFGYTFQGKKVIAYNGDYVIFCGGNRNSFALVYNPGCYVNYDKEGFASSISCYGGIPFGYVDKKKELLVRDITKMLSESEKEKFKMEKDMISKNNFDNQYFSLCMRYFKAYCARNK